MGKYNEELAKAGVLLAAEELHQALWVRVKFSPANWTVINGPFAEMKELIAGFWLWQVKSKYEAIERVKRCPNTTGAEAGTDEFGPTFTPERREAEERIRAQMKRRSIRAGVGRPGNRGA